MKDTIKKYHKEFNFVIISGFILGFLFITVFYNYSVIYITEKRDDDDDKDSSKKFIFGYAILEFVGKTSASLCKCASKRKRLFMLGILLIIAGWILIWLANVVEKFYLAKIGGAILSYASGCTVYPAFYTYLGDIPPPSLVGFFYSIKSILDTLVNLVSPFVFGTASPRSNFVNYLPVMIGVVVLVFIYSAYYLKETGGLKK